MANMLSNRVSVIFSALEEFPVLNILFGARNENGNPYSFNSVTCARHRLICESCGFQGWLTLSHCQT